MPTFYSSVSSFNVILENVNYSVNHTENHVSNRGISGGLNETKQKIITLISDNPTITTQAIANSLTLTRRKVDYHISQLKNPTLSNAKAQRKMGVGLFNR